MISRSLRSAIPPSQAMFKDSALALMYETINDPTAATRINDTNGSSFLIKNIRAPIKMAASLNLSNVESKTAPHLLIPLLEARATAPSKRSKTTKPATHRTPIKNSPLGKKYKALAALPTPPIIEIKLALTRILIKILTKGAINFATGSRNERCNIIHIVGLSIMADLINARFVLGISPENEQIASLLGVSTAKIDDPLLITADVVVVVASAKSGIDPKVIAQWHTFRELYVPTIVAVIDFEEGDVDFEDMSAIVGKMLEPVLTPYLVLHADNGQPTALINLEDQMITDYSSKDVANLPSEKEHRELIMEFKEELDNSLQEGGWDQFIAGLIIPAIPLMTSNKLGVAEIKRFLNLIPSRS